MLLECKIFENKPTQGQQNSKCTHEHGQLFWPKSKTLEICEGQRKLKLHCHL